MPHCRKCSAFTEPADWAAHQSQYHVWKKTEATQCDDCDFASDSLNYGIAHCLLEGHFLTEPTKSRPNIDWKLWLEKDDRSTVESDVWSPSMPPEPTVKEDTSNAADKIEHVMQNELPPATTEQTPKVALEWKKVSSKSPPSCKCAKCGKVCRTQNRSHLREHARSCCGLRPYFCSVCGYSASKTGNLGRHIRKSKCTMAKVKIMSSAGTEDAKALQECFPSLRSSSTGLH